MRSIIVGVGNLLRTDDGIGVHVINRLNRLGFDVDVIDAAMGGLEILEAIRGYDQAIIVDAIETGAEPGTLFKINFTMGEVPPVITHSHGVDIITTLRLGGQLYPDEMPNEVILIAVEAEDVNTIGDRLTPRVEAALSDVIKQIYELITPTKHN